MMQARKPLMGWAGALLLSVAAAPAIALTGPLPVPVSQRSGSANVELAEYRIQPAPVQLWPPPDYGSTESSYPAPRYPDWNSAYSPPPSAYPPEESAYPPEEGAYPPAIPEYPLAETAPLAPSPAPTEQAIPTWASRTDGGLRAAWRKIRRRFPAALGGTLIAVDLARQKLYLLRRDRRMISWPISASLHGVSEVMGSDGTPVGVFRVARMIGKGLPPGEILRDEIPLGRVAAPKYGGDDGAASNLITTRILWLSGLQPGWNEGGKVDTFLRHIYIHGTPNIGMLGEPASHGCIQMAPRDVIALFRRVRIGTPVLITPGGSDLAAIPGPHRARHEVVFRYLVPPPSAQAEAPASRSR